MMKRTPVILSALLVVALLGGGAWWLWSARADTKPSFRTQTVALGDVEDTVSAVGVLQPLNYVDVGTQVSGQLRTILVDYGERVEKGALPDVLSKSALSVMTDSLSCTLARLYPDAALD